MNKALIFLLLLLASCTSTGSGKNSFQPSSPATSWTFFYRHDGEPCQEFNFYQTPDSVGYCYKYMPLAVGQTITMTFTLTGNGRLVPPSDQEPATISLMLWRRGDDGTCAGAQQQSRIFANHLASLTGPGTYTISAKIEPDRWTDCYAKLVDAQTLNGIMNNLFGVAYTFGGASFAGHGVAVMNGTMHFKLDSFTVSGLQRRRK